MITANAGIFIVAEGLGYDQIPDFYGIRYSSIAESPFRSAGILV